MKTMFSRVCLLFGICLWVGNVSAQYSTNFSVLEVEDEDLEMVINLTVSDLLTTFNTAQHDKKTPDQIKDLLMQGT